MGVMMKRVFCDDHEWVGYEGQSCRECDAIWSDWSQGHAKDPAPQPPALGGELEVFSEDQWWLPELDSAVANGSDDQKRAVAVVRNLIKQHAPLLADIGRVTAYGNKRDDFVKELQEALQIAIAERDTLKAELVAKRDQVGFLYRSNGGDWEFMSESPFADGRTHYRENGEELKPIYADVPMPAAKCKTCKGSGIEYDGAGHICTACNGSGVNKPAAKDGE